MRPRARRQSSAAGRRVLDERVHESFRIAERAARESYGRLLATLLARTGDLAGAEDALSRAFLRALETWPQNGPPDNPDAWLARVALNGLRDGLRHGRRTDKAMEQLSRSLREVESSADSPIEDERFAMLFLCAHPAIDEAVRAPLMLQAVLGLDVARLAPAFLVAPATLAQRLVRAKTKIRQAGISLAMPDPERLDERFDDVLSCIYAAYTLGAHRDIDERGTPGLSEEALSLGDLAASHMPNHAEALGLLALMLLCEARRPGRSNGEGRFVPLSEQRADRWDQSLIARGEAALRAAARCGRVGRFQLEAAIQSVHCARAATGVTRWDVISALYGKLLDLAPTIGAQCGHAAAVAECGDGHRALQLLNAVDRDLVVGHQPYWATRGHVLGVLGRRVESARAFTIAIGLTDNPALRAWLTERRDAMRDGSDASSSDE